MERHRRETRMMAIRKSKGITRSFMARQLDVSDSWMYQMETEYDGAKPTALQYKQIAEILGVTMEEIVE